MITTPQERLPRLGHIFFVKYTIDLKVWARFYSASALQAGQQCTFKGCCIPMDYVLPGTDVSERYAQPIEDMRLDARMARILALPVRRPEWLDLDEAKAKERCEARASDSVLQEIPMFDLVS